MYIIIGGSVKYNGLKLDTEAYVNIAVTTIAVLQKENTIIFVIHMQGSQFALYILVEEGDCVNNKAVKNLEQGLEIAVVTSKTISGVRHIQTIKSVQYMQMLFAGINYTLLKS